MLDPRYKELFNDPKAKLTVEEIKQGWHFCPEWDMLLIGANMDELECCNCFEGTRK